MSAQQQTGGHQLGRYVLFDAIARGGMATVHFARLSGPVGFSRTVAIKRLHANFATDPEFVAMFLDEARLAGRIRHPNVVPTLDVVATSGEVFIVLEYVSGESLAKLWKAHHTKDEIIPIPYSLAIMANALHGLHAAHEVRDEQGDPLGIVHRDVSPQNVIVGTDGVARVLDFGVAKAAGRLQETGDSGALKGKIAYMAPEQITGGVVTRQTDVYAASVVLWELLTGRRLIEGENDAHRAAQILASLNAPVFERPSKYNPQISEALDELVMRGLSWPPTSRFATAREMAGHLEKNGGLIPATELGDWVTRLAGPALEERAGRLHAIEASTGRGKTYSFSDAAAAGPLDTEQTVAAAPPVFVDEPPAPARKRLRALPAAIAALALAVLGVGASVLVWRGRDDAGTRARARTSTEAPTAALPAVPAASSATTSTVASAEASAAPPPAAAPEPSSRTPKAKPAAHAAAGSAARPAAATKPNVDCDPPYVVDAENHKVYKRECLK
jgi:serine/threonine-protein kinase